MNYIIDRFEGDYAVCEEYGSGRYINIKKEDLPENLKEGDVIASGENGYFFNASETKARKDLMSNKFNFLWK